MNHSQHYYRLCAAKTRLHWFSRESSRSIFQSVPPFSHVRPATQLGIMIQPANDVGHGFSYILQYFEYNGALVSYYLVYVLPLRNLPLHGSPLPSNLIEVLVVLTTLLKMVGNSASSLVDSLIGLDWIASKHAASSLLERLFLNNYILMYITGGICKSVTFCDGAWDTV